MNAAASPDTFGSRWRHLPKPGQKALADIPGPSGFRIPLLSTISFLADPLGTTRRMYATYGPVFRNRTFGGWRVGMLGPDANELVLFDRDKIFSSEEGWGTLLGRLFPRGLMLMDFEEHRAHRRTLSAAFKPEPMQSYLGMLEERIGARIGEWQAGERFLLYPAVKQLTLNTAASALLGTAFGPESERINGAFVDMIRASIGLVRLPLPGTAMHRGVKGYRFVSDYFAKEIPKRRGSASRDIFTQFCNVTDEEGRALSDREIADHMNFLMFAAHDTQTTSLAAMVYYLAKHPEWQEKLREEIDGLNLAGKPLSYADLSRMPLAEMVFKEALRLNPPVPGIPRRAVKDFSFKGYRVPAGTLVGVNPLFTHRMPEIWPDPDRFDPLRFTPENSQGRHKYAWVPFGGGVHTCLGLHFAYMQSKVFLHHLLTRFRVEVDEDYEAPFQLWFMSKPKDGLPVKLRPL